MLALLLTVLIALGVSFLCSILEAALLSIRDTELAERAANGEKGAAKLKAIKSERLDDAISSILILNTIAHTIGAAMAGAQAADVFGDAWVGLFSAVLTLLVLVVTEIIPKTIGAVHASGLVTFVARTLVVLQLMLYPVLLLTRALTSMIQRPDHARISRGEVRAMVESAAEEGLLLQHESQIVTNALHLGNVPLRDVMTPRTVVGRLSADLPASALLHNETSMPFTRIPLFEDGEEDIIGYVLVPEILRRLSRSDAPAKLRDFLREIPSFEVDAPVGDALRMLIREGTHIAVVNDAFGGLAGIVTLEDLLETLLGAEIMDESDQVADLRQLAMELRDRRLGRTQERLQHQTEADDPS
ncbi:MAG: CNNM domain-containing protein [Planctomycetota bacterium]|nr:CNNM domain-containing protein [Planctomycetota bacterium]